MENRLKHLNRIIDQEMSNTPVFTEKDEQNILSAIKNTSPTRINRRKKNIVPRLLTAALFAGVILTSYTVIDNYLTPETTMEIEKENKPDIRYAQEFTQGSSLVTYDVEKRELSIQGTIMNPTDFDSEPFQVKVNVLNDDVANDLGTSSISLDIPPNRILKPDESYSFKKNLKLNLGIVDENTFKDAFEIVIFSGTKTLVSFVINNVDFAAPATKPDETTEIADQNEQPADQSETAKEDDKTETMEDEPANQENQTTKESLAELEKKYGKKRTPFTTIDVLSKASNFYIKEITLGKTLEQILHTIGPYDNYSDMGYHSSITGEWNIKSTLTNSVLSMEFDKPGKAGKVISIRYVTPDRAYVENWISKLGTPYSEKPNVKFFYKDVSQQMLIVLDMDNNYEVTLQYEENLEIYQ
ncbi:hypothetical protein ACFQ4X_14660 [Fictibacillus halophilus]|uniref:hypothetical protein n=1 Tax=Fictibacillus halophilus TaxID=1610490 RepID=UPI0036320110